MAGFGLQVLRLAAWLALLSAIFVPLERMFALHGRKMLRRQMAVDVAYYFLNSLAVAVVLGVPLALLAALVQRVIPHAVVQFTAGLSFWPRVAASFAVGEIGFYWGHRWTHEWPLLWRFHAIHHSAEEMDFITNARGHPVDVVFTRICGFVPIYALGLAQAAGGRTDWAPALVVVIATAWGFFIHANLRWRFGWLEKLVASPAFHHWHHTNDANRDRNYASTLPVLDWIFGSLHLPKSWPESYGIDARMPPGLGAQLMEPFVVRRASDDGDGA